MAMEAPRSDPQQSPATAIAERLPPEGPSRPEIKQGDFPPLPGVGLDLITLGKFLAQCGYFGDVKSISQAAVKVLLGQELGIPPVTALMNVYIVNNKPALSAGLMASKIKASKRYTYRIARLDEHACELRFFEMGMDGWEEIGPSVFTKDDAERAGLLRKGGSWSTFRRNMLFARALSNGARWYCPDLFGGPVYTPEELDERPEPPKARAEENSAPAQEASAVDKLAAELAGTAGPLPPAPPPPPVEPVPAPAPVQERLVPPAEGPVVPVPPEVRDQLPPTKREGKP